MTECISCEKRIIGWGGVATHNFGKFQCKECFRKFIKKGKMNKKFIKTLKELPKTHPEIYDKWDKKEVNKIKDGGK